MKLFISWSQPLALEAAQLLRGWLPEVVHDIEPWASEDDIDKGTRWSAEIAQALEETTHGLICVTPENAREPWLAFEAGALAKSVSESRVSPVLFGLQKRDLTGPLAEFQATEGNNRTDMYRLVQALNRRTTNPLEDARLERSFDRLWIEVESELNDIVERALQASTHAASEPPKPSPRSDSDVLGEILERVRVIERRAPRAASASDREPARDRSTASSITEEIAQALQIGEGSFSVAYTSRGLEIDFAESDAMSVFEDSATVIADYLFDLGVQAVTVRLHGVVKKQFTRKHPQGVTGPRTIK